MRLLSHSLALLLTLAAASPLAAQPQLSFPNDLEGRIGDPVRIPVLLDDAPASANAYEFLVIYDAGVLDLTDVQTAETASANGLVAINPAERGRLRVSYASASGLADEPALLYLAGTVVGQGLAVLGVHDLSLFADNAPVAATALSGGFVGTGVPVDVERVNGGAGETVTVPITIGDVSGLDGIGYQFTLRYDADVASFVEADAAGTLSDRGILTVRDDPTTGTLTGAWASTEALEGSGDLLNLTMRLDAQGGASLAFTDFALFDGSGGRIPTTLPAVTLRLGSIDGAVGDTVDVPVLTTLMDGRDVIAYQFDLAYDADAVTLLGLGTDGTLSASAAVEATPGTGLARIAAAQATPFSGGGRLVLLRVRIESDADPAWTLRDIRFFDVDGEQTLATPVAAETLTAVPEAFRLLDNYPNPFNPQTTIPFELQTAGTVYLTVHDALGRRMATLADGRMYAAGTHTVVFDAADLPSGLYLYRLTAAGHTQTRTMLLVK